jgi:hypothetical protein
LKSFVINREPSKELDEGGQVEQMRLLNYYKHRFCTFIAVMKEALIARRVKGPVLKSKTASSNTLEEEKSSSFKVFSLNPSQ